jgi:BirA family transcriptional regulator, biotin operon repressor / biotin---[acetyl-CoA-carboxylase] ligase
MNIIKLSAINSTNDYLKKLLNKQHVENYTVVVAEHQTAGRGQMGSEWHAESGKNLTFSVLIKDLLLDVTAIFNLNAAVAVSVVQALETFSVPGLAIKWPNDILAGNKKIGGILIENNIKSDGEIFSIAGIGLNVNQINFEGLPKASSLKLVANKDFDKDVVLNAIITTLRRNIAALINKDSTVLWDAYHRRLFKKDMPMPFESRGIKFMGIIRGVTGNGNLEVLLEDNSVASYSIKEIQLLY